MWSEKPIRGNSLPDRTLSFTFDDGPGCPHGGGADSRTLELAHYLAEEGIEATFFVVGQHLLEHPGFVGKLRDWGHSVGNHSFSHFRMTTSFASDREIAREVRTTSELLNGVEDSPLLFRPPFGGWAPRLAHMLNSNAFTCLDHVGPVHWDVCAQDYAHWQNGSSPETCARAYRKAIEKRPGGNGIVLLHDRTADDEGTSRRNRTCELMRIMVPRLRDEGFSFTGLRNVPEVRDRMQAGVQCSLRASNSRYLSARETVTASAAAVGARERFNLFRCGGGGLRVETVDGRVIWESVRLRALTGESVAFETGESAYLAWNRVTGEVESHGAEMSPLAAFRFMFLGTVPGAHERLFAARDPHTAERRPLLQRLLAPRVLRDRQRSGSV